MSVDKVLENLTRVYWFIPKMREKIKAHIENCLKCIEFSPSNGKQEGYLHNVSKGVLPFDTVHLDDYGPLEKSRRGNKYVFAAVDAFTKHIRLFPCKTTKSDEVISHLRDYFRAYSRPRRVISDRGTSFTSKAFRDFLEDMSVAHVLVAVGTPRANGQIERFNRVLTPLLAKLSTTPEKWDEVLNDVEFALNNTVCRSTGETPAMLLFGVRQAGDISDNIRKVLEAQTVPERNLGELRERAAERITRCQQDNERRYNLRHRVATLYKVGDRVMIRNVDTTPGVNKKLVPKFKGPYEVKKVLTQDRYVIGDVDGFQLTQMPFTSVVGPDQMKFWIQ